MKSTFKTFAIAALIASASAPAFADGHLSTSMTCEEYNGLSGANRDKVAMMAIAELQDNAVATDGTATATASSVGTEGTESASGTGTTSATATTTTNAGDDMTDVEERMSILNRTCSRNWDANVMEAAAGQSGTR